MELQVMNCLVLLVICALVEGTKPLHNGNDYGQGVVSDMIKNEMNKALQYASDAETKVKNAERTLWTTERRCTEYHSAVEFRQKNVDRLQAALKTLHYEKRQAETAKDQASRVSEEANKLEEVLVVQLTASQQKAGDMMTIARAIAEEAARARAAATAAQQPNGGSTDFIPVGFEQTRVTLVKNAEILEHRAAQAMGEAKQHQGVIFEMAKKSTAAWLAASKANEELTIKKAVFKAKCEAYANTLVAYNKAVMELRDAESKYKTESTSLDTKRQALETMKKQAKNFQAVNIAFNTVFVCADFNRGSSSEVSGGGGSSSGGNNGVVGNGGSSSDEGRGGGSSSGDETRGTGNGGSSSDEGRGGGSSSEEGNGAVGNGGSSSEERGGRLQPRLSGYNNPQPKASPNNGGTQGSSSEERPSRLNSPVRNGGGSSSEEHSTGRAQNLQIIPSNIQTVHYQYPKHFYRQVANYYQANQRASPRHHYPSSKRTNPSPVHYNNIGRLAALSRRGSDEDD